MLDILFENRNKDYGAYLLRKGYNARLLRSLMGMTVLVAVACGSYIALNGNDTALRAKLMVIPDVPPIDLAPPPREKEPEPSKPKPASRLPVATIPNTTPVIVREDVKIPPPTTEELDGPVAIGTETRAGVATGTDEPPAPAAGAANAPVEPPAGVDKVFGVAEIMPEFPGGIRALQRFLQKNLTVPAGSLEPGQQLRVPIRFVVNKDGVLSDLSFTEPVAHEFRREIERVMNRMPRWKAGLQNGHPVAVYFMLPIIFAAEGE